MHRTIKVSGPFLQLSKTYKTPFGKIRRFDLRQYAETVQYNLASAQGYNPHHVAQLLMSAITALIGGIHTVAESEKYICTKLERALGCLGYEMTPSTGIKKDQQIITQLPDPEQKFPANVGEFKDSYTGMTIGLEGVLKNLDILEACLTETQEFQSDRAAQYFVQAVKILACENPEPHLEKIEGLLWKGANELGYELKMAPCYRDMYVTPTE